MSLLLLGFSVNVGSLAALYGSPIYGSLLTCVLSEHEVDDKLSPPSGWGPLGEDSGEPMKVFIADSRLSIFSSSRAMRASDASAIAVWELCFRVDSDGSRRFFRRRHLHRISSDHEFNQLI